MKTLVAFAFLIVGRVNLITTRCYSPSLAELAHDNDNHSDREREEQIKEQQQQQQQQQHHSQQENDEKQQQPNQKYQQLQCLNRHHHRPETTNLTDDFLRAVVTVAPPFVFLDDHPNNTNNPTTTWMEDIMSRTMVYGERQEAHWGCPLYYDTLAYMLQTDQEYMHQHVYASSSRRYDTVRHQCHNQHVLCTYWAVRGECDHNPDAMKQLCAPACHSCEYLSREALCYFDPHDDHSSAALQNVWDQPGDVNRFFERIVHEYSSSSSSFSNVTLTIASQPTDTSPNTPWILVLDNFLTSQECDTLIQLGREQGYQPSKLFGHGMVPQLSFGRTSRTTWCMEGCHDHPTVRQNLWTKVEQLTHLPYSHAEYLQLLQYQVGEYYKLHNDYIEEQVNLAPGVRILTLFFYLNDVPQGGQTQFPHAMHPHFQHKAESDIITVQPRQGRAVLWPSVQNHQPHQQTFRTHHEALPVIEGEKYAANLWFHQRDWKTPLNHHCF